MVVLYVGAAEPSKQKMKQRMVAKYSYQANEASPLGEELSAAQGEKLFYIAIHPDNTHWWSAENDHGDRGYVPASYMMVGHL